MRQTACTVRGNGASLLIEMCVRAELRSQQMTEMPLAEHDNVVKTFPPDRTDRCVYRNLNPNVLTMKSAQYGARTYDAGSLNRTRDRRILVQ
jgi:hypothetical protein